MRALILAMFRTGTMAMLLTGTASAGVMDWADYVITEDTVISEDTTFTGDATVVIVGCTLTIEDGVTLTFDRQVRDPQDTTDVGGVLMPMMGGQIIAKGSAVTVKNEHGYPLPEWASGTPIVIQSADPEGQRSHFMKMPGSYVEMEGIEFRSLGRTTVDPLQDEDGDTTTYENVPARYSIHWHRTRETSAGSYIGESIVVDPFKAGVVIHEANHVTVENVAVAGSGRQTGAGFVLGENTAYDSHLINCAAYDCRGRSTFAVQGDLKGPRTNGERYSSRDAFFGGYGVWSRFIPMCTADVYAENCRIGGTQQQTKVLGIDGGDPVGRAKTFKTLDGNVRLDHADYHPDSFRVVAVDCNTGIEAWDNRGPSIIKFNDCELYQCHVGMFYPGGRRSAMALYDTDMIDCDKLVVGNAAYSVLFHWHGGLAVNYKLGFDGGFIHSLRCYDVWFNGQGKTVRHKGSTVGGEKVLFKDCRFGCGCGTVGCDDGMPVVDLDRTLDARNLLLGDMSLRRFRVVDGKRNLLFYYGEQEPGHPLRVSDESLVRGEHVPRDNFAHEILDGLYPTGFSRVNKWQDIDFDVERDYGLSGDAWIMDVPVRLQYVEDLLDLFMHYVSMLEQYVDRYQEWYTDADGNLVLDERQQRAYDTWQHALVTYNELIDALLEQHDYVSQFVQ